MKPMNEMTDDELDHLFIRSAEEMEIPFDPASWAKMQQKLDQGIGKNKPSWMRWGWAGLALLLVGILVVVRMYLPLQDSAMPTAAIPITEMGNTKKPSVKPVDKSQPIAEKPKTLHSASSHPVVGSSAMPVATASSQYEQGRLPKERKETDSRMQDSQRPDYPHSKTIREEDLQPLVVVKNRTAELEGTEVASLSDASGRENDKGKLRRFFTPFPIEKRVSVPNEPMHSPRKFTVEGTSEPATAETAEVPSIKNNKKPSDNEKVGLPEIREADEMGVPMQVQKRSVGYLSAKSILAKPVQIPSVASEMATVPVPDITPASQRNPWARLGVRFILAPDLTTVGFRDIAQPSTNVGLQLEYALSDRWVIAVGGIYAKKLYDARGSDYNPPSTYWTHRPNVNLVEVKADCRIIDLPLVVRYNFIQHSKNTWFATVGSSSYLMKRETYQYGYYIKKNYDEEYLERNWSIDNSNNHFFAVGNFSVGYERAFSSRFSWQIEPFVKVPLSGVGFGKVRLISSGIFFSLKYHPRLMKY